MSAQSFLDTSIAFLLYSIYILYFIAIWLAITALVLMVRTQGCNRNLSLLLANIVAMSVLFIVYAYGFHIASASTVIIGASLGAVS